MPRLYLLDEKKVVLLKNTDTEGIESYLYEVLRNAAEQQAAVGGAAAEGAATESK